MAATPTSFRSLIQPASAGNLTISYVGAGPFRLTFTQAQQFHKGEAVAWPNFWDPDLSEPGVGGYTWGVVTIDRGYGTLWQAVQRGVSTGTGVTLGGATASWRRTDPGTSRARGGGWTGMHGVVPDAVHYLYVAPFDEAGSPDWYTYIDTIIPINGKHPYTRDQWTGKSWLSVDILAYKNPIKLVPDTASRIAALDAMPPVLRA